MTLDPGLAPNNSILRMVDWLIFGAAVVAAALLGLIFVSIIFDVVARYTVRQPPPWPVPVSEYALHIAVVLAAPYVLQQRGHVVVDLLLKALPGLLQRVVATGAMLLAATVCAVFAYLSARAGVEAWRQGYVDIRAIVLPQAVLFAPMALSFTLMTIEFLRIAHAGTGAGRREAAEL